LLLDEPAAGKNGAEKRELGETIVKVREEFGVTIVLIEHHIDMMLDVCTRVVVMERGTLLAEGTPREIRNDERVVAAYLGQGRRTRKRVMSS
jgi:ABC-type branched-subunit amino acid transport system ATPase component